MPALKTKRLPSHRPVGELASRLDLDEARETRLANRIRDRIQLRLGARIHDLHVGVKEKSVVLSGRCATYYSKQLAQHAALGALEDEHLENTIVVTVS